MYIFEESAKQQLELFERSLPFDGKLDPNNRWIVLAHTVNWSELERSYAKLFSDTGRPGLRARHVIGTLILKHQFQVSDEEIVHLIIESPYLQYFIGLPGFVTAMPFDSSSLSRVRERLGEKTFKEFEKTMIDTLVEKKLIQPKSLQVDATVFESNITYPTDCGLLNEARKFCVEKIREFSKVVEKKIRTYCRDAQTEYLIFNKTKNKSKKKIRLMQKSMLQYLRRNIEQLTKLIDKMKEAGQGVSAQVIEQLKTIKKIYEQQKEMYDEKKNSIENRIVSLSQSYVRPIVRGKSGKKVEFGAKVQLSYVGGYLFADYISFDAFNESTKLQDSVKTFEKRFDKLPDYVAMDQIYGTRENRTYLKEKEIRSTAKKLGRKKKDKASDSEDRWRKRKQRERNRIEGAIGNSKTKYDLKIVRAKTEKTERSWIQMSLFCRNLMLAASRI